jgi:DNA anti-recombination protein RmuC
MENSNLFIILLALNFIGILTTILILSSYRSKLGSGQNNELTNVIMNLNTKSETGVQRIKDDLLKELYGHKEILNSTGTSTALKIQENLNKLQTSINSIITDSLGNLQKSNSEEMSRLHNTTKSNFEIISSANDKKLGDIQGEIERRLNDNLNQNLKSFEEVSIKLGAINKSAENMISSTASIDRLNDIFSKGSVKQYGTFAEEYLQNLLEHHLPTLWDRQVTIEGCQDKIDFTITFQDMRIGIDSKFPLEAYENYTNASPENQAGALKTYLKTIREMSVSINTKYGKHFDHLLMYLPSDSMYNEVAHDRSTLDSLNKLKVVPISPTTILTVIYAISILRTKLLINKNAQQMQANVSKIEKSLFSFKEEYRKLGEKLRLAQVNYDVVEGHVRSIDKDVNTVKNLDLKEVEIGESDKEMNEFDLSWNVS